MPVISTQCTYNKNVTKQNVLIEWEFLLVITFLSDSVKLYLWFFEKLRKYFQIFVWQNVFLSTISITVEIHVEGVVLRKDIT